MSSKPKSSLSDTPVSKATPGTPRVAKLAKTPSKSNADSPSSLQNTRASFDRSPRTATSKSSIARLSPRVATPPEKVQSRILKPSELQSQLATAQDELKKAKEKLLLVEKEKSQALSELEESRKLANDANEKLRESVVDQKQVEECSEVEIFQALELEQVGNEAAGKKEEEWQKEHQEVRNQHAIDMASLMSTSEELQRVKQELAMVTDIKNQALIHADEAMKIAEIHAEKVEVMSAELVRLKSLLDSTIQTEATGSATVMELKLELDSLNQELEIAKGFEKNLAQKEESCVLLESELTSVKEELERAKGLEKILAQKEESCEQQKLEFECIKQEFENAKGLEENLFQKEESLKQLKLELESLKEELEKAKSLDEKLSLRDESYEQLKLDSDFLKHELEKAKGLEKNLVQKEELLQQLNYELESLNQELEKAKGFEEKLSWSEESYEQLKLESDFLKHELVKAKGFEENLVQKDESLQQLKLELEYLKQELEKAISIEEKLSQREASYEQLNVELEASRMAEFYAHNLLEEWKNKADALELQVEESSRLEESLEASYEQLNVELEASRMAEFYAHNLLEEWKNKVDALELQVEESSRLEESLESVMKQLEEKGDLLHEAECEIKSLKEKVSLLEISLGRQKADQEELEENLEKAREEASAAAKEIVSLKSELETVEEEKVQALENEKLAAYGTQQLLEEKKKLVNETEALREEDKKSKNATESLTSALHEVSAEAREAKEKLLASQAQHQGLENQIEDLKLTLKATNEKYESLLGDSKCEINHLASTMDHSKLEFENEREDMRLLNKETNEKYEALLSDAKQEIDRLKDTIQHLNTDHQNVKSEWDKKEVQLSNRLKTAEDEKLTLSAENEKCETMLDDAKQDIDHLRKVIEESKMEYETSKSEWQQKELELVNSVRRFEEERSAHKTPENYGILLDDAKDEIKHLSNMMEKSKVQHENSKREWEEEELRLLNSVKRSEEEKSSMEEEIVRLVNLLRGMEEEARSEKEEGSQLRNTLKEAISEATFLREALDKAKAEVSTLKTDLQHRQSQLQALTRENEHLQASVDANIKKAEELSKLFEEATARKQTIGNGELSDSEKDYDMLPRVVEFSEENGDTHRRENQPQQPGYPEKEESASKTVINGGKEMGEDAIADSEPKMWESCQIDVRDFSMEREGEHESVDDELDSKAEAGDGFDQLNVVQSESNSTSPSKDQQQKKKKPLYRKFGNLLKKGIGNQK